MTLKSPNVRRVETIGYARRSYDHPIMSYIGWEKDTAFDSPVVYRADLEEVDQTHKERYNELQSKYLQSLQEQDEQCERIRELEQYISSRAFVAKEVVDYEMVEDDTMPTGLPSMEHNQSSD